MDVRLIIAATRVIAVVIAFALAFAVLRLLLFAACIGIALRLAQHTGVMFRVLLEVFRRNPVIAQLGIPRKLRILINDLLRRTAHFTLRTRAIENPVDDISDRAVPV